MRVGADNRFQKRQQEAEAIKFSGLAGGVRRLSGIILQVWDHAESELPIEFRSLSEKNKDLLFGEVQGIDRNKYMLVFGQSASEIYMTYGNSTALIGMPCDIEYRGNAISSGKIKLGRGSNGPVESYEETNFIASISLIVGNE